MTDQLWLVLYAVVFGVVSVLALVFLYGARKKRTTRKAPKRPHGRHRAGR